MATAAVISGVTITSGTAVSVALSTLASGTSGSNTVVKQGVEVSTSTSFTGTASVYGTTSPIALSTGLIAGSTYYFRVSGYTSGNVLVSGSSSDVVGPITMVAKPAAAPTVAVGNGVNTLTLAASLTGAASYTIQRDTATTFNTANLLSVSGVTPAASYVDNGSVMPFGAKGTTYYYRYYGVAADGTSLGANSASSAAAVYATVPDAPTNLALGTNTRTTTAIPLSWTAVTNTAPTNGGVALSTSAYTVQRSLANADSWTSYAATATVTNYNAASLTANTQYDFRVTASNARGASTPSNTLSGVWTMPNASIQPTVVTAASESSVTMTLVNTVAGQVYNIIPYLNGTAQAATQVTGIGGTMTNVSITNLTANAGAYTFRTQAVNGNGDLATISAVSAAVYLGNNVVAPAGRTYQYPTASTVIANKVTYTGVAYADAVFSNDGSVWSITAGGQTDTLAGVKWVALSDKSVFLYGAGSGCDSFFNTSNTATVTNAINLSAQNGDVLMFAKGQTYITTQNQHVIDRQLTLMGVGPEGSAKAKIQFKEAVQLPLNIKAHNVTIQDLVLDNNDKLHQYSATGFQFFVKISHDTYPMVKYDNILFKNVDFTNLVKRGVDIHYASNVTMDGCTQTGTATAGPGLGLSAVSGFTLKNSTILRGMFSSITLYSTDQSYIAASAASWAATPKTGSGTFINEIGTQAISSELVNYNIDLTENNTFQSDSTYGAPVVMIDLWRANNYELTNGALDYTKPLLVSQIVGAGGLILPSSDFEYQFAGKYPAAYNLPADYTTGPTRFTKAKEDLSITDAATTSTNVWGGVATSDVSVTKISVGARIYPLYYEAAPVTPTVTPTRHADGSRIDLSWTDVSANADSGMDATDPYTVAVSPSAGTITYSQDKLSASVTGLTNGVSYSFTVTAKNAAGLTAASNPVSATPAKIPDAPTGDLSLTAQDTSITVSCSASSDPAIIGGSSIAGYLVNVYTAATGGSAIKTVDASSNPVVVTDLSDNTDYYFSVQVKNDVLPDYSAESARAGPKKTVTNPGPPSVNTPTAGYKSISLSWSAPTVTGGNTSFTYKVKRTNGGAETEVVEDVSGTSHTLSGLTADVEYTVFVAAVGNEDSNIRDNSYSLGQQVTPYSEPGTPAAPTLTSRTSTSIAFEWNEPAINGKPITQYKVRKSENGGVTYTTLAENITGTSYTANQLSPNTSYKFTVAAYNLGGWSENSEPLTVSTTVSAPTITTLTGVGRALVATVTPPSGATVNNYGVKVNGSEITPVNVSGTDISFDVSDNVIGSISVVVYAITDAGNGADSSSKSISVPIADPNDQASAGAILQEIIDSGATEAPVVVANNPSGPIQARILDTANQAASDAVAPNQVVVIKSSETQPLKDEKPVAAVKFNSLTNDNAVKDAMDAAKSTGTNRIAITEERQVGTSPQTVTTVLTVNTTASTDIIVSNNTVPPANPTYSATATITPAELGNIPVGSDIAFAIEPKIYDENDPTKPAPVEKQGVAITFKIKGPDGSLIKDNFTMPVRVYIPSKANAPNGKLSVWHYHDDENKFIEETPAEEDLPDHPGWFTFTQTHNENVMLTDTGSNPNAAPPLCFLGNARVLTPAGYRRIDSLAVGDKVKTADGRTVAIQRVIAKEYAPMRSTNPYVIPAGQFGATEEVLISPKHCVAVAGRGMVEASKLGLEQRKMSGPFTYYNLELPCHDTDNLVVGGVEVESLANVLRIEVTKEQFVAMMRARYGVLTPDLLARAARACFITATGKVNMPVFKRAASK